MEDELREMFPGSRSILTNLAIVVLVADKDEVFKFKRPVVLPFVDQSDLEERKRLCELEVSLNTRFLPPGTEPLYLGVKNFLLPKSRRWEPAVHMRKFRSEDEGDAALASGKITDEVVERFAQEIARIHATLPRETQGEGTEQKDQMDNIDYLKEHAPESDQKDVAMLGEWLERKGAALQDLLAERRAKGMVRECHGDLHLSNLLFLPEQGCLCAFDCLEFSRRLSVIDVVSDVAFLAMDLSSRGRSDLAWIFLSAYFEASGDYQGVALLRYFLVYRSLVRAKIAAIGGKPDRVHLHVELAKQFVMRRSEQPTLYVMCGLSGTGKSFVSAQLVPVGRCIRIRSDYERKRLFGAEEKRADVLYAPENVQRVYNHLEAVSKAILSCGESLILDATNLSRKRRDHSKELAKEVGAKCVLIYCCADTQVLLERVALRKQRGCDPSEADEAVVKKQMQSADIPPGPDELPCVTFDTTTSLTKEHVRQHFIDRGICL